MRKQCQCRLPYVHKGTATCTRCGEHQTMFLPVLNENPVTQKIEFNGTEFKNGDIVEVIGKSYACLVEIQNYIQGGWYRVQLPNGGFHETQILGSKVS